MLGGLLISSLRGSILLVPAHNPSSSRIAMLTAASTPFAAASGSLLTCFCLPFFFLLCPNSRHWFSPTPDTGFPQLQTLVFPNSRHWFSPTPTPGPRNLTMWTENSRLSHIVRQNRVFQAASVWSWGGGGERASVWSWGAGVK